MVKKAGRFLSSTEFFDLLRIRNQKNRRAIDDEILARSTDDLAILVSDSAGFTRRTREEGILQFLAVMTRCYDRLIPILEKRRGICLSHDADNLLAIFRTPTDAVSAAIDMHRWLARHKRGKVPREQFHVCIGVHFGTVVRLKDNVYGDPVNIAAKIGEDLAAKDEILVTPDVVQRLDKRFKCVYSRSTELGGRMVELYRIKY